MASSSSAWVSCVIGDTPHGMFRWGSGVRLSYRPDDRVSRACHGALRITPLGAALADSGHRHWMLNTGRPGRDRRR
jgi:hypothetical protein